MRLRHLVLSAVLAGALVIAAAAPPSAAAPAKRDVFVGFVGASGVAPGQVYLVFVVVPADPVTFDLVIRDAQTNQVESGYGGEVDAVSGGGDPPQVDVPLDVTGLPTGSYLVDGTATLHDPDQGDLEAPFFEGEFQVDATPPVIDGVNVSSPVLYPVKDHYLDEVFLYVNASDNDSVDKQQLDVQDAHGDSVRVFKPVANQGVTWAGTDSHGKVVPAGVYTVFTTVTDASGNTATDDSTTIRVSHKRLVHKTFTKTVTAKASILSRSYVGKCSTLRFPSARGWKGSMGLYTATKCQGTSKQTLVSTVHELRVPKAVKYGRLQVNVYGGAAKAEPRSLAYISYFNVLKRAWKLDKQMGTGVRSHWGSHVKAAAYLSSNRKVAWDVYTWGGAKYDVKNFTVELAYAVLR